MTLNVLALLVCIFGLLLYVLTDKAKPAEIGRLSFWVGLFVVLAQASGAALRL